MADTDTRRDSYRGGGQRFNGNKRKRGREDDDAGDGNRAQRQQREAPPGTRIRRGLVELGEDAAPNMAPRSAKSVADTIAKLAVEHWQDEFVKDTFCLVVLKIVVEQPLKIPLLAGTVLIANEGNREVGERIISKLVPLVQDAVNAGHWRQFKLYLRFLACIGQLFEADGVIDILDELFNRAVDLQTASSEDVVGVELVKIILLTIPYLIAFGVDEMLKQRSAELLEKTDIVASAPHILQNLVEPYPAEDVQEQDKSLAFPSTISLLQQQLQAEAAKGWPLSLLVNIYTASTTNGDSNGTGAAHTSSKHQFPTIEVPAAIRPGPTLLLPEIHFSMFLEQDIESVPPLSNIAACLVRDSLVDTINDLDYNRHIAAKLLNELDNFWAPGTFAKRGLSLDKLKLLDEGAATWKPEDMAVEAIFSQLLKLPSAEHKHVYYHSVMTELCKISPQAIAPSLGRTIRYLYRHVNVLDLELVHRFMDWFAHHLSNFEFRWKWQEWVGEVDGKDTNPKKAFIVGALEKESRLSFPKRIRDTLPIEFQHLMSDATGNEVPDFKFANDKTPYASEGQQILALLKQKAPESEIEPLIDSIEQQAASHGVADPRIASIDVYMTAICSAGSKSLSHILTTIDRCKDRLLRIGTQSDAARRQIISSVVDFWKDHPGHAVNIVDKLLNYTVITPMNVIEWALRDHSDRGRTLCNSITYEVVATTMIKVTNRLGQIVQQRNNAQVPFEQRKQINEVLPQERQSMAELFTAIDDAVDAVATGAQDGMIERFEDGNAELEQVMTWGKRWQRVWRRKAAVEEAVIGEATVQPLEEPMDETGYGEQGMDTFDEVA